MYSSINIFYSETTEQGYLISIIYLSFTIIPLILLASALGSKTKVHQDNDNIILIGVAIVVCFLLCAVFLGNDLININLSCEPLYSQPGYTEITRVYISRTYDLFITSNAPLIYEIHIQNMPAAMNSFLDLNGHPAIQILYHHYLTLFEMLMQLDISFTNKMGAPETPGDELELNKLKTVLNLIYKIHAILTYYVPSFPALDLPYFAWLED